MYASWTASLGSAPSSSRSRIRSRSYAASASATCRSPRARASKADVLTLGTGRRRRAHGRRAPPLAIQRRQAPDRFSRSTRVRAPGHRRGDDATPPPMAPQPRAGMSAVRQTRRSRPVTRPVARHQQRRQTPRCASLTRRPRHRRGPVGSAKVSSLAPKHVPADHCPGFGDQSSRAPPASAGWARPTARRSSCFERRAAAEKVRGKRTVGGPDVLGACCRPAGPTALRRMFRRAAPGPIHPSPQHCPLA